MKNLIILSIASLFLIGTQHKVEASTFTQLMYGETQCFHNHYDGDKPVVISLLGTKKHWEKCTNKFYTLIKYHHDTGKVVVNGIEGNYPQYTVHDDNNPDCIVDGGNLAEPNY